MSSRTAHTGDDKVAAFITGSATPGEGDTTEKFTHKYKWRGEEIGTLIVLYAGAVALGVYSVLNEFSITPLVLGVVVLLCGIMVTRLGLTRKSKSRLLGTYHPETTELVVEGNGLEAKHNNARLATVKKVTFQKVSKKGEHVVDPRDMLMLHLPSNKYLRIPMRLVSDDCLHGILSGVIAKVNTKPNAEVEALMEAATKYGK